VAAGGRLRLITADVAVQAQMRAVLPYVVGTLTAHGTAVTLEGVLLARKAFGGLAITYTGIAISCGGALVLGRRAGGGLAAVWATYVWYLRRAPRHLCGLRRAARSTRGAPRAAQPPGRAGYIFMES